MTDHAGEGHEESSGGSLAVLLSWLMGPPPTGELRRAAEVGGHVVVSGVKNESDRLHQQKIMTRKEQKLVAEFKGGGVGLQTEAKAERTGGRDADASLESPPHGSQLRPAG